MTDKKQNEYYVDRTEMWEEINDLYTRYPEGTEIVVSDTIAVMFYKICNKLKASGNFVGYTYDMASEAFELVLKKFKGRKFKLLMQEKVKVVLDKPHKDTGKMFVWQPVFMKRGRKLKPGEELGDGDVTHLWVENDGVPELVEVKHRWTEVWEDTGVMKLVPSNFFGYVTTMAYRSFQSTIVRERKYHDGVEAYRDVVYSQFESDHSEMKPHVEDEDETFFDERNSMAIPPPLKKGPKK